MKGVRGRFFETLKSISTITTVKQGLVLSTVISDFKNEDHGRALVSLEEIEKNVSDSVEFEEKCPPGGSDAVVLYTTSLRGIRKTFEDCNTIRFLLGSFRVSYDERDVSMHMEFREELWRTLGGRVIPPRLFIKGRHIGGVEEVVGLHEQGKLEDLLNGIPRSPTTEPCKGCGGIRFRVCFSCNGSRKVVSEDSADSDDDSPLPVSCLECNENGLVKCAVCF
ncbi:hypothetical protein L2E82_05465 [Cichorium intybus]|uniref:Uncharacterized protein n=1 Tax=Cichorium intybus TaxID=13427 RepID=A0ACB9H798_CICIN|nr:hypothetical protein L2E82_05465 [Cichorium intybus]